MMLTDLIDLIAVSSLIACCSLNSPSKSTFSQHHFKTLILKKKVKC